MKFPGGDGVAFMFDEIALGRLILISMRKIVERTVDVVKMLITEALVMNYSNSIPVRFCRRVKEF